MPSWARAASAPPTSAAAIAQTETNGIATARPTTLGNTRREIGEIPMVIIASISSVMRMTPICAVMAEPERPASRMATRSGPSSRMIDMPRRFTM